ncbi:hypothetical protein [Streptomyces sp. NPDC007905]|uniref:hypothetical protein n=1 Tax=Streptomyces sp. NPDC007905 TaxID=3364788 RepID=UPI0036EC119A
MFAFTRPTIRDRALAATGIAAALTLALAACGAPDDSSTPGMHHGSTPSAPASASPGSSMSDMPGMDRAAVGNGLADSRDGYRMTGSDTTLKGGKPAPYRFMIIDPAGKAVTGFALDQTKRMHFYAIRSHLTGFQHLHPTMASDGTWTADLAALTPGSWRMFASFTPDSGSGKDKDFVLSRTLTVPGTATRTALPPAGNSTQTDGYTVTVSGGLMAGMAHPLTVRITKDGKPVTDLQPYLDTYAPDRVPPGRCGVRPPPPHHHRQRRPRRTGAVPPRGTGHGGQLAPLPAVPDRRQAPHGCPDPARRLTPSAQPARRHARRPWRRATRPYPALPRRCDGRRVIVDVRRTREQAL